jgi:hypothetical protein
MSTKGARGLVRSGQALVEFAVVLPILLLLMIGLVNLGILVNAQIVLTQAAWEGARAGATIADPSSGDDEITGAVRRAASPLDADAVLIAIEPTQSEYPRNEPGPLPRGYPLTVRLEYPLTLNLPFTLTIPVRAQAVSRMEYSNPP